jgi:hypothetical protein
MKITTIDHTIREKLGLSITEYLIAEGVRFIANSPYSEIKWAVAPRKKLSEFFGISQRTVDTALSVLIEKNILEVGELRYSIRTTKEWYEELINSKFDLSSSNDPSPKQESKKTFSIPTLHDLNEYAASKGFSSFNSEAFYDHYEAVGWVVGRNKMKNWHASVNSWVRRESTFNNGKVDDLKKNSNGAVVVKTGFDAFVVKCQKLSIDLHNDNKSNKLDEISVDELEHFTDNEKSLIKNIGFAKLIQNCQDGDFMMKIKPIWEEMK